MRTIFRILLVLGGLVVLGLTYKTNILSVGKTIGYIIGAAMLVSYFWGKEIGGLLTVGALIAAAMEFFNVGRYLPYNGYLLGLGLLVVGLLLFWIGAPATNYYCTLCGQYLGTSPHTCPRCGGNVYRQEATE